MRLADWILLSTFAAVMITGTGLIIGDLNSNYGSTMDINQLDGVMNVSAIQNASVEFQSDIRSAQNSTNFISTMLNGLGAASSLVGLAMTSIDQLFGLAGSILGGIFGIDSIIGSLMTGAIITLVALLIISSVLRWELTK